MDRQDTQDNTKDESIAFLERQSETLRKQLEEFSMVVYRLDQRIDTLERRLVDLNERVPGEDPGLVPPPHSAGPDVPKDPI